MRTLVVTMLTLPLLLAGCVSTPAGDVASQSAADAEALLADARALMADVPCEATVDAGTSANLLEMSDLFFEEQDVAEADIRGDLALVARHALGGFTVVDISDPAALRVVGEITIDESNALDVKWTPDGTGALVGSFGKIFVVDMADVTAPVVASVYDYADDGLAGQAHMVTPARIDGEDWVYVATQTTGEPVHVFRLDGLALTYESSFGLPAVQSGPLGNHDILFIEDEMLDAPVLYVADGVAGWAVFDLTDPAAPARIGGTLSPEPGPGYTHAVRVAFMDGKRIVVTMSEVGANTLKVYDATDLQTPILLGQWQADRTRPHIPQHNIQIAGDHLYLAHYTEGVYVFDISGIASAPPVLGSLDLAPVAHYAVKQPGEPSSLGFANVWEVLVKDGVMYVTDEESGFLSIGFGCVEVGDVTHTSTY